MSMDVPLGLSRHAMSLRRRWPLPTWPGKACKGAAVSVGLWALGVLLWGCAGSSANVEDTQVAAQQLVPAEVARLPDYASLDPDDDPRKLTDEDLNDGPGSQEVGVSVLLREIGVMELLDSYMVNIPPTAEFIALWEANKASVSNFYHYADAEAQEELIRVFEMWVLQSVPKAMTSLPEADQTLHEAFFEVLDACGRASAWPEVDLYLVDGASGYDKMSHLAEPMFGMSYFEYQQLRHQCARYAATYPTLDSAVRDDLLKPQREHYAKVILDRMDYEMPRVEVPAEYQDEIEDLRANGW